ncbi:MarR family winged helix-turn-helix transcriptional regulator [Virgibacillus soli]|uniref:MarR family transcriptional regulator n=1 Tax=Paracerasibacillus soli TaxID=480284 RepID=A0ABU5CQE7_9BACI|nr:MarR family transcriptional regulator [Virgibacillus soli]MDY0408603.1 MarR family transcriptional regulator [Virgibacillus soli]
MEGNLPKESVAKLEKRLRHISGAIKQNGRKILANYPITSPQFIALQWIIDEEGLTIGELSNRIGLAFSTTTDLVDRMEKNGLVRRIKDEHDRRVVRIQPLEKGKSIIKEVIDKRREYLGEVLDNFTTEQTEVLNELLTQLYDKMILLNNR